MFINKMKKRFKKAKKVVCVLFNMIKKKITGYKENNPVEFKLLVSFALILTAFIPATINDIANIFNINIQISKDVLDKNFVKFALNIVPLVVLTVLYKKQSKNKDLNIITTITSILSIQVVMLVFLAIQAKNDIGFTNELLGYSFKTFIIQLVLASIYLLQTNKKSKYATGISVISLIFSKRLEGFFTNVLSN